MPSAYAESRAWGLISVPLKERQTVNRGSPPQSLWAFWIQEETHRPGWMLKQTNDSRPGVVSERTACLTGPRRSSPGDSSPARPPSVCTTHSCFNWVTSLVSIWLIKERYYLQISMSQSYFLLIKKKWFNEKKNQGKESKLFSPQSELSGSGCRCQKCLNNRILTWRLESKQHEEILKAKQPPLSHSPKDEWWVSICASRAVGQGPDRATNCPSACLHTPEMVTGQTVHFPWNWTKPGGSGGSLLHVIEEEQAEFSWE